MCNTGVNTNHVGLELQSYTFILTLPLLPEQVVYSKSTLEIQ